MEINLWADETKMNVYQNDWKRKVWRNKGTLVFINDLTADRRDPPGQNALMLSGMDRTR